MSQTKLNWLVAFLLIISGATLRASDDLPREVIDVTLAIREAGQRVCDLEVEQCLQVASEILESRLAIRVTFQLGKAVGIDELLDRNEDHDFGAQLLAGRTIDLKLLDTERKRLVQEFGSGYVDALERLRKVDTAQTLFSDWNVWAYQQSLPVSLRLIITDSLIVEDMPESAGYGGLKSGMVLASAWPEGRIAVASLVPFSKHVDSPARQILLEKVNKREQAAGYLIAHLVGHKLMGWTSPRTDDQPTGLDRSIWVATLADIDSRQPVKAIKDSQGLIDRKLAKAVFQMEAAIRRNDMDTAIKHMNVIQRLDLPKETHDKIMQRFDALCQEYGGGS